MPAPDTDTVFDAAHAHVMKWEGEFFDHPNDPGGVTNYGVSLMFLKGLGLVEGDIDRDDILAMTKETAHGLFRRHGMLQNPGFAKYIKDDELLNVALEQTDLPAQQNTSCRHKNRQTIHG